MLTALSRRIAAMTEQLSDLAFLELPARLAKKLLELATEADVAVRVSQEELARHLACSRESAEAEQPIADADGCPGREYV